MYPIIVILRITPLIHSSLTFETAVLDFRYSNRIEGKPLFSLIYILHHITIANTQAKASSIGQDKQYLNLVLTITSDMETVKPIVLILDTHNSLRIPVFNFQESLNLVQLVITD
jgi:hypothetical protein